MTVALTNNMTVPPVEELQSYRIIAEVASHNPHWRKQGGGGTHESVVATILSIMLLARELGISPILAISGGINNVNGRFEISARLMNQLIRRSGHKLSIRMSSDTACIIWTKRKDTGEEHEERYTIEDAARAGIIKEGSAWKKVPTDMLFARCISRLARRIYADCIAGCFIEGEIQETVQKKVVESIELPTKEELELTFEKVEAKLLLPNEVSTEHVETFIKETSEQTKRSVEDIKKRASENLDAFLKVFRIWEEKTFPISEVTEEMVCA